MSGFLRQFVRTEQSADFVGGTRSLKVDVDLKSFEMLRIRLKIRMRHRDEGSVCF